MSQEIGILGNLHLLEGGLDQNILKFQATTVLRSPQVPSPLTRGSDVTPMNVLNTKCGNSCTQMLHLLRSLMEDPNLNKPTLVSPQLAGDSPSSIRDFIYTDLQ